MSDDIINFYKKTSNEEVQIDEVTPIVEPIVEKVEEVNVDPFQNFLQTLAENLEKTKASEFQKVEEHPVAETLEDPFKKFLTNVAGIIKKDTKVQTDEQIKEATIEFINKLKDEPEAVKEEAPVVKKQKKSYLPKKFLKKLPKKVSSTPVEIKSTLPAINLETGLPEGQVVEQVEDEIIAPKIETDNTYVRELKTADKSKKIPDKITKPGDIKSLIEKQVREQVNKLRVELGQAAMTAGGGGTVAVQYANGGTMNGDLNVTGKYLSGGRDLATIFTGGGGGSSDRLISGSEQLVLNLDGSVTFPDNVIRPAEDTIITLESENTALSAFTRVALSPYAFFAYDGNSNSVTFDSVDNTITLTSQDQYEWRFNDKGELIGPGNILTVNSTLSTIGKILSGDRDLADIFLTASTDSQTLAYTPSSYELSISNGNSVSLASLSTIPTDLSFLSVSGNWNTAYNIATAYQSVSSNLVTTTVLNSVTSILLPTSVFQNISSSFATNTLVNNVSSLLTLTTTTNTLTGTLNTTINNVTGLLTPLTLTNNLTGQLVTNASFSDYQTNVTNITATLLPTTAYQNTSGSFITAVSGTPNQINASKSGSTVTLSLPSSAVFPGDVSIIGNLTLAGSATYINTQNLVVGDNIIYFNNNNYGSNVLDVGFVSHFTQAPLGYNHTGLVRRAGQGTPGVWTLFSGLTSEPLSAANIDWNDKNIVIDSLSANLIGNVTGNADTVTNGVYTNQSYADPSWITSLADTKITGNKFATNTLLQSTSALLTPLTLTNTLTSQLVLNTAINSVSGNWNTAYQTVSTIPYTLISGTSSIDTVLGLNNATGNFSSVLGGNNNTASGIYSTVVNGFSSCATGYATFVGAGSGNRAAGDHGFIGAGRCNAICSGNYNAIVAGECNTNCGPGFSTVAGGQCNTITSTGNYAFIAGGRQNTVSNWYSSIGGGYGNSINSQNSVIAGGGGNCISSNGSNIGGGCRHIVSTLCSNVNGGIYNTVQLNGGGSNIDGGRFNHNPIFNSIIGGGSFNHTGGYTPGNITTAASISGNGTNTALILNGIGSCFSATNTTNAVSLVWMTSGTANSSLSSACFTIANVVTNAANCIVINGDYSTCRATSLSACNIWVFDRCLNTGGCYSTISGGVLNTASSCYTTIGGGIRNLATGRESTVGGGGCNTASALYSTVVGGRNNTASGVYAVVGGKDNNAGARSFIGGGRLNTASSYYGAIAGGSRNCICTTGCNNPNNSFIGSGLSNCVCHQFVVIAGGAYNGVSGPYSFIASGSANCIAGNYSSVAGGCGNCTGVGTGNFIGSGNLNTTSFNCAVVVGGWCNSAGGVDFVGGGVCNTASANYSVVVGGVKNNANANYSFIAGGQCNSAAGFANTFILGSSLSAIAANYTYVNNISSQGAGAIGGSATINGTATINGRVDVGGIISSSYAGATDSAVVLSGGNTKGGAGYNDFLRVYNPTGTNSLWFRSNNIGSLEVIRSDYGQNLFTLSQLGNISVYGGSTAISNTSNDGLSGTIQFNNNNSQIYDDGNFHIHSRGTGQSMWINTNGGDIRVGQQPTVAGGTVANSVIFGGASNSSPTAYVNVLGYKTYAISGYGYLTSSGTTGRIDGSSGNVNYGLYVANRTQSSEVDVTSDERVKEIQGTIPLEDAIKFVKNVDGIKYTWKEGFGDDGLKTGFGAQSVHKAGFEHMIGHITNDKIEGKTDEDGWIHPDKTQLTMGYNQAIPYHHEVIKSLLNRIEELEATVTELKNK